MMACKIEGIVGPLQPAHHQASFERADNQRGQLRGINGGVNFTPCASLPGQWIEAGQSSNRAPGVLSSAVVDARHLNRWPY